MALIDKEQICAEIKAQKNAAEGSYVPGDDNNYWYGKVVLCDELLAFIDSIPEQPEEGLEEAAKEYARNYIPFDQCDFRDILRVFKAGAEWQKAKDQKTIELAEDHAMLAGMNMMEQQMMEKGYEAFVSADNTILVLPMKDVSDLDLDYGDKVRVIVIKEE